MIFLDTENPKFIDPNLYESPSGIFGIGGNLNKETLWEAYDLGLFPWFAPDEDILWWCPNPRFVLFPAEIKISKSMRKILKNNIFSFTENVCFEEVIRNCRQVDNREAETWLTDDLINSFIELHLEGKAKSIEVWQEGELVGGFYGMEVGNIFCGESMFSKVSNASKAGFINFALNQGMRYDLIDCQIYSTHLESLGAREISKDLFLDILHKK